MFKLNVTAWSCQNIMFKLNVRAWACQIQIQILYSKHHVQIEHHCLVLSKHNVETERQGLGLSKRHVQTERQCQLQTLSKSPVQSEGEFHVPHLNSPCCTSLLIRHVFGHSNFIHRW